MIFCRTILPVALIASVVVFGGCTRGQARRDTGRDLRTVPGQPRELARAPVASPMPPTPPPQPPAEPPVAPPKPDALNGIVPPMPDGGPTPLSAAEPPAGVPPAVSDSPLVQTGGLVPESDADRKKRLERREDRRERREERRDERQDPPPPTTPATQTPPTTPPAPSPPAATAEPAAPAGDSLATVRKLVDASAKRYAEVPDFACRLVSQEVVKGKQLPKNEIDYRFRQKPLSVYMKTLSEAGQGREVMYVQGRFDNEIHLITGKGDNRLVGVGYKTSMSPDDSRATAKSRYRIYEAGLSRTIKGLQKAIESHGQKGGCEAKALGQVKRPEYPYPLEGVEITTNNAGSDVIAGGGSRQVFFDPKADSPSYMLPVLIVTRDLAGREIEYYSFTQFKAPAGTTDADWDPARLGK
ncbi:MAG TPA: DUF1571 domain-containing protein [Fimbriiglobus sp.]|jgi:hypothetical protein|nr:DUF1571 domain-containing protein [Fimbriiglobus sp.]